MSSHSTLAAVRSSAKEILLDSYDGKHRLELGFERRAACASCHTHTDVPAGARHQEHRIGTRKLRVKSHG